MKQIMLAILVLSMPCILTAKQVRVGHAYVSGEIDAVSTLPNKTLGDGDGFKGFDSTTGFSTKSGQADGGVANNLGVSSLSLLGGFGELNGWSTDNSGKVVLTELTHRGARGLGVWGGEQNDEIDNNTEDIPGTGAADEYIQLVFNEPILVSELEVRSLFKGGIEDDIWEEAEVYLAYNGFLVSLDTLYGVQPQLASRANPGTATLTYNTPQVADEIIIRIPAGNSSECAFARLKFYYIQSCQSRWTGGGTIGSGAINPAGAKVTHGFELHNDLDKPNNLEVNCGRNKFHLTELTSATCFWDNTLSSPNPPEAPTNRIIGTGAGKYNGIDGYLIYFNFTDVGEPGLNDNAYIRITTPDGLTTVMEVGGNLSKGNNQAHKDNN